GNIGSAASDFEVSVTNLNADTSSGNGDQFLQAVGTARLGISNALNAGSGTITLTGGTFQIQGGAGGNAISDASQLSVNAPAPCWWTARRARAAPSASTAASWAAPAPSMAR